jgi:hypothetical protein
MELLGEGSTMHRRLRTLRLFVLLTGLVAIAAAIASPGISGQTSAAGSISVAGTWGVNYQSSLNGFASQCVLSIDQENPEPDTGVLTLSGTCGLGSATLGAADASGILDTKTGYFTTSGTVGALTVDAAGYTDGNTSYGSYTVNGGIDYGTFTSGRVIESAQASINAAAGGSVSTGSGGAVEADLYFPPGSLQTNQVITVSVLPPIAAPDIGPFLPDIAETANPPSMLMAFELGPTGTVLNAPAYLTLTYQQGQIEVNEDTLGVVHFDGFEYDWLPVIARDLIDNTVTVAVPSFSLYGMYEPVVNDQDGDGCRDVDEQLANVGSQLSGGRRNPLKYWDVYDAPTGTYPNLAKDHSIAGTDFFAIIARFGATGTPPSTAAEIANIPMNPAPGYHPVFDRNAASNPPDPSYGGAWNTTRADGAISGTDFFGVLAGFGMVCIVP